MSQHDFTKEKGLHPNAANLREIAVLSSPYEFPAGAAAGELLPLWAYVPDGASSPSLGSFCDTPAGPVRIGDPVWN